MISLISSSEALLEVAALAKQHRLSLNLSQQDLSQKSNVSLAVLRKFEKSGKISLESFIKLLMILNKVDPFLKSLRLENIPYKSMDELLKESHQKDRKRASKLKTKKRENLNG